MDAARKKAWEFGSDEEALLALAGNVSAEVYAEDRRQRAASLLSLLAIQPSHRLFEVGSGDGAVARVVAGCCARLDCNDISDSFLAKARETCAGVPNVRFHKIGPEYLAHLPSQSFNAGFSLNVFIHLNIYDIFHYLTDASRVLRPGGLFCFDACTVGVQTRGLFREHAAMYREDPSAVRGLLNFNHPRLIEAVVGECGLRVTDKSTGGEDGWMNFVVQK
jgi:SAM-dependent methyltransferase